MCIVADDVNDISSTKIACFHVAYKLDNGPDIIPSQLVVYAANVDSVADKNAFILPVYNPGNNYKNIIPLDFSKMSDFFDQMESVFSRWFYSKKIMKNSRNSDCFDSDNDNSHLPVYNVGDYKFSIMPSKLDFNNIDRNILNINPVAKNAIDAHSNDYSFIVYQFYQKGNINVTPFAYLCKPYSNHSMVVPTIHGHPHHNTQMMGFDSRNTYHPTMTIDFEETAEFNHEIYCLINNPSNNSIVTKKDLDDLNLVVKNIETDYMNRKIRIYVPKSFIPNKININGIKHNRNLLIQPTKSIFMNDLVIDLPACLPVH